MNNPCSPPPEKMSAEISTAIWIGLMLLAVVALIKFVFR